MRGSLTSKRAKSSRYVATMVVLVALGWICIFVVSSSSTVALDEPRSIAIASKVPSPRGQVANSAYSDVHVPRVTHEYPTSSCMTLEPHRNVTSVFEDITLCFNEDTCQGGYLSLSYRNPTQCTATKRTLSRNATLNKQLLEIQGPDVFRYRLEGPETVAGMSQYLHSGEPGCSYRIHFPDLYHPGVYQLGLEWLYRDYHALDEITNQWPRLLKAPLLPIDASFQTNYHLQQCTLPSTVSLTCKVVDTSRATARQALTPCNGLEALTTGRWVIDESAIGSPVHTRVRVKKIQRNPIVFQWALQRDIARLWEPDACRLRRLAPAAIAETLSASSQRMAVGGDSQLRALYYGLANFINGHGEECVRNITTLDAEPRHCIENVKGSQRKLIHGVQLDFVDDLFLDRFAGTERYSSYQTVIVGFGQHPASKEHWSFDKYRNAFWGKLRRALALKKEGRLVIWYLAPQYPHTTNGFPVVVRDWRTDVRLKMFNEFTKEQCLAHGIPVVDAFSISTPFGHTSPDQAHFSNFVSFEFVQAVLNVICERFGGACASAS